eukprot:CAMPEP_0114532286 /NCGR_PEP_ID=MMETSP0109-20121206/26579_1 /TAXON_ID=29199 /ORGANISM="Chlorarachnion reptans, Strain CCCM449" /LENGTH=344 /DNA_ID=CAMNT_0001715329 /DNA_START=256 /DNA_END=1287 /DNA_ORIENTATION=+
MVSTAIYIARNVYRATRKSARMRSRRVSELRDKITDRRYILVLGILLVTNIVSTILTLAFETLEWVSIRHFGQAFVLLCIGPYTSFGFYRLKRKVQQLQQLHQAEIRNKRDTSNLEVHYQSLMNHISKMIYLTSIVILFFLTGALYEGILAVLSPRRTFKHHLEEENQEYDPIVDVIHYISLATNFYFQYYSSVPIRPFCCYEAPQVTTTVSKVSRDSSKRIRSRSVKVVATPRSGSRSRNRMPASRVNLPMISSSKGTSPRGLTLLRTVSLKVSETRDFRSFTATERFASPKLTGSQKCRSNPGSGENVVIRRIGSLSNCTAELFASSTDGGAILTRRQPLRE